MNRFEGKVALITGAGSGIGEATCARFLAEGGQVVAVDRTQISVKRLGAPADRVTPVQVDLSTPVDDDFIDRFGEVDVLVNAAGILHRSTVLDHSLEEWERTLAVNVGAPHRLSSLFVRQRIRLGLPGAIVNVCSIESFVTLPNHIAYTVSKAAMLMMTRAFGLELAPYRVRVNGIAPGVTETGMNQTLRADPKATQELTARIPAGRFGRPEEQAAAIAFLASDEASYITGAVLPVDGGWLTA